MILEKSWKPFIFFILPCKFLIHFVPVLPEGELTLKFRLRFKQLEQMGHVMGEFMNEIQFYLEVRRETAEKSSARKSPGEVNSLQPPPSPFGS